MDILSRNEISCQIFIYEVFRILKWVTKQESVTPQVRKDARGCCI